MAAPPQRLDGTGWLDRPDTQAVLAALAAKGFVARAVGGAVRNSLAGRPVVDVDIATDARPEDVMRAAQAAGLKAVPTGLAHGTVTVIAGDVPHEVTTLRKDVESHGRHATVAFTDDWAEDARRRDFTLNALYCDADGTVFDPLGGYPDLVARRVRFIGEARDRIREDYLRILRFFRLTAEFAEGPADPQGLLACVRERAGIAILSAERIRIELLRTLAARRGPEVVRLMQDYGLLPAVLGAAPRPALLARFAAIEAGLGLAPDAALRLAALAVEIPEDAERLRDRLRLSNGQAAKLLRAADWRGPGVGPAAPEAEARAYLYRHGTAAYREHILLAWARSDAAADDAAWRHRLALPERWQPPRFPLKGADVIALGLTAGPRVGEVLRTLENWWIATDFVAAEPALRARLEEMLADDRRPE
ncbi:MAG TPA: CCA tRNA nucleotidyltransferase [Hyphomicrobiaceae bacterium]|nr:CCA tRNA nucleotidyltransferase [Hyphomicrobiaceae bacterium]